jgi:hypothetical protein
MPSKKTHAYHSTLPGTYQGQEMRLTWCQMTSVGEDDLVFTDGEPTCKRCQRALAKMASEAATRLTLPPLEASAADLLDLIASMSRKIERYEMELVELLNMADAMDRDDLLDSEHLVILGGMHMSRILVRDALYENWDEQSRGER